MDVGFKRKTHSSLCAITAFPSSDRECETSLCNRNGVKEKFEEGILKCKLRDGSKGQTDFSRGNLSLDVSPGERSKLSVSTSTTPASCSSSAAAASPICKGDEYLKQSCRKNLSVSFLVKEIGSLISDGPEPSPTMKDSRRRRDMANVRVLFSHHLDDDIIKHQTKVLLIGNHCMLHVLVLFSLHMVHSWPCKPILQCWKTFSPMPYYKPIGRLKLIENNFVFFPIYEIFAPSIQIRFDR